MQKSENSVKIIDIKEIGAKGDGISLDTIYIQKAINECADAGGGIVRFPAGRYLSGTIQIKSNVTLQLDQPAILIGSTEISQYQNLDPFIDGSGNPMGHALIVAVDAENVGIEGEGKIDGQGPKLRAAQTPYTIRPFLIRWVRCRNITVRGIHLTNPGAWTLNFFQSSHGVVDGITIRCRGTGLHNNDGVNIDSSEEIRITNCDILSGDDALVIKSTSSTRPSRNITATGCTLSTRTNAIKIGTESIGGFENIHVSNCQIFDTQMAGIAMYAVDGGDLRNVTISDIHMEDIVVPISIRLGSRLKCFRSGEVARNMPGKLENVTIRNISAKYIGMIGILINGVHAHPVESLTLENIHIRLPGGGTELEASVELEEHETAYPEFDTFGKIMPAYGMYIRHVKGIKLINVTTDLRHFDARPEGVLIHVEDIISTPSKAPQNAPEIVVHTYVKSKAEDLKQLLPVDAIQHPIN